MISGLSKFLAVALSYAVLWIAELAFTSNHYYFAVAMSFSVMTLFTTIFAVLIKSKQLWFYAALHFISVIFHLLMTTRAGFNAVDYLYYGAALNFGLIVLFYEAFIIVSGGIDVYRSFVGRADNAAASDDRFDARMGVY